MKNQQIQKKLDKALRFKNQEEAELFECEKIQLDIIAQLQDYMTLNNISKSDIAKSLNTSKSFITQLFSGDKLLNLKTLAKLQRRFNIKFITSLVDVKTKRNFSKEDKKIDSYNRRNYPNIFKIVSEKNLEDIETELLYPDDRISDMDYEADLKPLEIESIKNYKNPLPNAS